MNEPKEHTIATIGNDGNYAIIAQSEHHDVWDEPGLARETRDVIYHAYDRDWTDDEIVQGLRHQLHLSPAAIARAMYSEDGADLSTDDVARALYSEDGLGLERSEVAQALRDGLGLTSAEIEGALDRAGIDEEACDARLDDAALYEHFEPDYEYEPGD